MMSKQNTLNHFFITQSIGVYNKIWWLCLVPTSTTRFASDVVYRMAKNLMGLYKEIILMNNKTASFQKEAMCTQVAL